MRDCTRTDCRERAAELLQHQAEVALLRRRLQALELCLSIASGREQRLRRENEEMRGGTKPDAGN